MRSERALWEASRRKTEAEKPEPVAPTSALGTTPVNGAFVMKVAVDSAIGLARAGVKVCFIAGCGPEDPLLRANGVETHVLDVGCGVGGPARLLPHRFNRHTFWCGQSGSGKTYALSAAHDAWTASGYRVIGAALSSGREVDEGNLVHHSVENTEPPSTMSVWPLMNALSSEARNTTHRAISSGSPSRPRCCRGVVAMSRDATAGRVSGHHVTVTTSCRFRAAIPSAAGSRCSTACWPARVIRVGGSPLRSTHCSKARPPSSPAGSPLSS